RVPPRDADSEDLADFAFDGDLDDCGEREDFADFDDFADFEDFDDFDDEREDDADDLPERPPERTRPSPSRTSDRAPDARLSSSRRASAFASSGVRYSSRVRFATRPPFRLPPPYRGETPPRIDADRNATRDVHHRHGTVYNELPLPW
ncbi:hypothetical protein, partial [Bifidobacterium parmae]|uniref:hypothetical protein n=1 Tax=Bifidobacterium parmae TaxID=361854 RepID=UPI000C78EECC